MEALFSVFPFGDNTATISLPLSPSNLGLFIAYMFQHQYAVSTTNTYVSALGYCHRLMGLPDPSKVFWVMEMLKGYRKMGLRIDSRLPITLPILLISTKLFRLCVLMSTMPFYSRPCVQRHFLHFYGLGKLPTVPGLQRFFKQSRWSSLWICLALSWALRLNSSILSIPITIRVLQLHYPRRTDICPVQSLLDYFSHRGLSDGPLFKTLDGHAVSRKTFSEFLSLVFRSCGLDSSKYKGHSFRIGAATFAADCGFFRYSDSPYGALEI